MQQTYSRKLGTKQTFEEWPLYEEEYEHDVNVLIMINVGSTEEFV